MILVADIHLTDNPAEAYRWDIFATIRDMAMDQPQDIFILGDLCDRSDRHSAELVNRLIEALGMLSETTSEVHIIMGNHDKPKKGEPFWKFLSHLPGVTFYDEPAAFSDDILLLPFAANPMEAWADLALDAYPLVFLHQPVNGAIAQSSGHVMEGAPELPEFGEDVRIYAGDQHIPQKMMDGRFTYIGAPHPIHFGDTYKPRIIRLDEGKGHKAFTKSVPSIRRLMVDVTVDGLTELPDANTGDHVRIRITVPQTQMDRWPSARDTMRAWADKHELRVFSIEPIILASTAHNKMDASIELNEPMDVLHDFADVEKLDEDAVLIGEEMLSRAITKRSAGK